MSSYMADLSGVLGTRKVGDTEINISKKGSNMDLDMTDFITLMITQLTNQGIDSSMDTSEMLNQMVQMQMIQSMVNMTDATMMGYSASLVGKNVTVGKYGEDGKIQEIYGPVTGTGTMDGQPVIFVNDEYYYLSEIMAVGKLPEKKEEEGDKVEGAGKPGETQKPSETEKPEETQKPGETVEPGGETGNPENSGTPENSGE